MAKTWQIMLSRRDFDEILSNYSIGVYLSEKHVSSALWNLVYIIKTTKGKFVLKIHRHVSISRLRYILGVVDFVRKNRIPVPEVMKTRRGNNVLLYDKQMITIQRFMEGKPEGCINNNAIRNAAYTIGHLNGVMLKIPRNGKFTDHEDPFESRNWRPSKILSMNFKREEKQIRIGLENMDKGKLRKSTIHADLNGVNILYRDNKVSAIIDWDDVSEYLSYV